MLATYLKLSPGEARPRAAGWCGDSRLTIGFIQAPIAPGGDALAGEHAEPERERAHASVQGGMTPLLVTGVQPAAGNTSLAGIRAGARFSSCMAR